jgi:hypothetical protein
MAARRPFLLIVLPLALAACGGSSTTAVDGDPLGAAADATGKQTSEHVAVDAKVDLSGQTLSLSGSGPFARTRGELRLKVNLGGFGSSELDEVFQDAVVWLRSPLLTGSLHGKHWLRIDATRETHVLGLDLRALLGQTPTAALAKLRLRGDVSTLGRQTVDGVQTTHYRKSLSGRYRALDAWVDDQNLVRRLRLDYDALLGPASDDRAHTVLTMTLSDFGSPVTVTTPPADDVAESSAVRR